MRARGARRNRRPNGVPPRVALAVGATPRPADVMSDKLQSAIGGYRQKKQRAQRTDREVAFIPLDALRFTLANDIYSNQRPLNKTLRNAIGAGVAKHISRTPDLARMTENDFQAALNTALATYVPGAPAPTTQPEKVMHEFLADLSKPKPVNARRPFSPDHSIDSDTPSLGAEILTHLTQRNENSAKLIGGIATAMFDAIKNPCVQQFDDLDTKPDSPWAKLEAELNKPRSSAFDAQYAAEIKSADAYDRKQIDLEFARGMAELKRIAVEMKEDAVRTDALGDPAENKVNGANIEHIADAVEDGAVKLNKIIQRQAHAKAIEADIKGFTYTPAATPGAPSPAPKTIDAALAKALGIALATTHAEMHSSVSAQTPLATDALLHVLSLMSPDLNDAPFTEDGILSAAAEAAGKAAARAIEQAPDASTETEKKYYAHIAAVAAFSHIANAARAAAPGRALNAVSTSAAADAAAEAATIELRSKILSQAASSEYITYHDPVTTPPELAALRDNLVAGTGTPHPPRTIAGAVDLEYRANLEKAFNQFATDLAKQAQEIDEEVTKERIFNAGGKPLINLVGGVGGLSGSARRPEPAKPGYNTVLIEGIINSHGSFRIEDGSDPAGSSSRSYSYEFDSLIPSRNIKTAQAILTDHKMVKGDAPFHINSVNTSADIAFFLQAAENLQKRGQGGFLKRIELSDRVHKYLRNAPLGWTAAGSQKKYNEIIARVNEYNRLVDAAVRDEKQAHELKADPSTPPTATTPPTRLLRPGASAPAGVSPTPPPPPHPGGPPVGGSPPSSLSGGNSHGSSRAPTSVPSTIGGEQPPAYTSLFPSKADSKSVIGKSPPDLAGAPEGKWDFPNPDVPRHASFTLPSFDETGNILTPDEKKQGNRSDERETKRMGVPGEDASYHTGDSPTGGASVEVNSEEYKLAEDNFDPSLFDPLLNDETPTPPLAAASNPSNIESSGSTIAPPGQQRSDAVATSHPINPTLLRDLPNPIFESPPALSDQQPPPSTASVSAPLPSHTPIVDGSRPAGAYVEVKLGGRAPIIDDSWLAPPSSPSNADEKDWLGPNPIAEEMAEEEKLQRIREAEFDALLSSPTRGTPGSIRAVDTRPLTSPPTIDAGQAIASGGVSQDSIRTSTPASSSLASSNSSTTPAPRGTVISHERKAPLSAPIDVVSAEETKRRIEERKRINDVTIGPEPTPPQPKQKGVLDQMWTGITGWINGRNTSLPATGTERPLPPSASRHTHITVDPVITGGIENKEVERQLRREEARKRKDKGDEARSPEELKKLQQNRGRDRGEIIQRPGSPKSTTGGGGHAPSSSQQQPAPAKTATGSGDNSPSTDSSRPSKPRR